MSETSAEKRKGPFFALLSVLRKWQNRQLMPISQDRSDGMVSGILFDLDGTLIDTAPAIIESFHASFKAIGFPAPPDEALRETIGRGLNDVLVQFYPNLSLASQIKAIEAFRAHYESGARNAYQVFEGIPQLLDTLRQAGFHLAVMTSKPADFARRQLEHAEILDKFDSFFGGSLDERNWQEDKADRVRRAIKKFDLDASDCFMIGDRVTDIEIGHSVGLVTIAACWGYEDQELLLRCGADYYANVVSDIERFIVPAPNTRLLAV